MKGDNKEKMTKITEQIAIKKGDSTLTKLCKFCCWIAVVLCFLVFGLVWLIFFIVLGGPTTIYKLICLLYRHHENKKLTKIARRDNYENDRY